MTWVIKMPFFFNKHTYLTKRSKDFNFKSLFFSHRQNKAYKFKDKKEALKIVSRINNAKLIKLKTKKKLFRPEQDTVFIDYSMPTPTPHIVASIYEDRGDFENKFKITEFVCTNSSYSGSSDDIWGTLEEFNEYLEAGKIKIIWDPNKNN